MVEMGYATLLATVTYSLLLQASAVVWWRGGAHWKTHWPYFLETLRHWGCHSFLFSGLLWAVDYSAGECALALPEKETKASPPQ